MEPSANKLSFLYMYQLPTISDRPKNLSVIRNFSPNEEILVPDKHRGKVMDDSDSHIYYYIEYIGLRGNTCIAVTPFYIGMCTIVNKIPMSETVNCLNALNNL